MTFQENYMKKDNFKATYILAINFKQMQVFGEKPYFPHGNEKKLIKVYKIVITCFFSIIFCEIDPYAWPNIDDIVILNNVKFYFV